MRAVAPPSDLFVHLPTWAPPNLSILLPPFNFLQSSVVTVRIIDFSVTSDLCNKMEEA